MGRIAGWLVAALLLPSCYGWTPAEEDGRDARRRDAEADGRDAGDDAAEAGPCAVPDRDRDGDPSLECGGTDCNDDDPLVHRGAPDNTGRWTRRGLLADGWSGLFAVEPAGMAHICYEYPSAGGGSALYHAAWVYDGWAGEIVATDELGPLSGEGLALGPDDVPHVVYISMTGDRPMVDRLWHATRDAAGVWTSAEVARSYRFLFSVGSPAVDARGAAHVAFVTANPADEPRLYYATDAGGTWAVEDVEPGAAAPDQVALACEPSGVVHLVYPLPSGPDADLRHAVRSAAGWIVETIPVRARPGPVALAVGGDGAAHILFSSAAGTPYGTNAGGRWTFEAIDPLGASEYGGSLALDAGGSPHVAYLVLGWDFALDVRYARRTGTGWEREEVEAGALPSSGGHLTLRLDASGAAHLVCDDGYFTNAGGAAPDGLDQDCDGVDG